MEKKEIIFALFSLGRSQHNTIQQTHFAHICTLLRLHHVHPLPAETPARQVGIQNEEHGQHAGQHASQHADEHYFAPQDSQGAKARQQGHAAKDDDQDAGGQRPGECDRYWRHGQHRRQRRRRGDYH